MNTIIEDGWTWRMKCPDCGAQHTGRGRRITTDTIDHVSCIDRFSCDCITRDQ